MEELPTDVEMAENGPVYGVYDDEFYESIDAPMYVDFTQPFLPVPDDSPAWFCARIGCTKKHDPELDPDIVYRKFMLRVMAARSPNVRCRKIWNTERPTDILKCPLSAPPKSSKPKLALLSCIAQKQGAKSKVTHVSSKYMSSHGIKEQEKEKMQAVEGCGNNPEVEGSMKEKSKGVVKELVFPSSLKDGNQGTSNNASVADVTAELKKLKVRRPPRTVPSRYATYFSQMPKHSSDAVDKSKQVGSTVPCKDTSSKKAVAKNMIDGQEEENKPKGKLYVQKKASTNFSKDSNAKGEKSLPLNATETSEKQNFDAKKDTKIAVVPKRVLAGKEKEKKPAGKMYGLRKDVAKLDRNCKVEKKASTSTVREQVCKGKESLPLPKKPSTGKGKAHTTSDVTMGILPLLKGGEEDNSEKENKEQPCQKINDLERDNLSTIAEEKASAKDLKTEGEECITSSSAKTSTEKEKVDATDSTKDNIGLLEGDLASADKENVTASECNRNPNLTASEAERSSKKLKERVLASTQVGGKAKKPTIMPTNPKPFRLRTDERSILKEMNLEKKRLLRPAMPSCSAPITNIDSKNAKHENLRKFKRGHPI